jgi:MFS family permease
VSASLTGRLGESLDAFRGIFANPNIRRVQLAFAGAITGMYAYGIAVAVFAYEEGGATAVGVLVAVRLAIAAAIAPFAASFADRYRREVVMLGSDLLRVGTVGTAALAAHLHWSAFVVYAMATLTSVAGTVFRPAEAALLPTLARTPEELTAANVTSSTIDSVGSFVGPALGALLLALSNASLVFAFTAATFAWSASMISGVRSPRTEITAEELEEQGGHDFLGGMRAIRHEPRLRLLIGLYGAQALVAGALGVLVVVTALRLLDLGNAGVGILEAASGIGSILGAGVMVALLARKRLGEDLALGIFLWGAPLVVLGIAVSTPAAIVAFGLVGLGNTLVDVSAITLLQRATPTAVAARVFGVLESATIAAMAVGALLAPGLVGLIGPRGALIITGGLLPVLVALSWRQLRVIDAGAGVEDRIIDALRRVPFLAPLPLATLEFLGARVVPQKLAAGATLFRRGDHGDRFYILTTGTIEIGLDEGAKRQEAPAYVGEIALLHDVPRTATVEAGTACELLALDRDDFLAAVAGHAGSSGIAQDVVAARLGVAPGVA